MVSFKGNTFTGVIYEKQNLRTYSDPDSPSDGMH